MVLTYLIVANNVQNALPKLCCRLGTVFHAVVLVLLPTCIIHVTVAHVPVTEVRTVTHYVQDLRLSDNSTNQDFPSAFLLPHEIFFILLATFFVPK